VVSGVSVEQFLAPEQSGIFFEKLFDPGLSGDVSLEKFSDLWVKRVFVEQSLVPSLFGISFKKFLA